MHVLGEVLKYLLYVGVALVVLLFIDTMLRSRLTSQTQFDLFHPSAQTSTLIVYMPGILADGVLSSDPVRDTWLEFGHVLCVGYGTERFNPEAKAKAIAKKILSVLEQEQPEKLVFVLSSMGGILGLDVQDLIRDDPRMPSQVDMIAVDGIQGSENMLGGGNIVAPIISLLPFGPIYNAVSGPIFRKLQVPPKDEDIQEGLAKDKVKKDALAATAPYKPSIWRDQMAYMAGHADLDKEYFQGVSRVHYMMCTRHNETVKQPDEARKWATACKAADVKFTLLKVPTPHCAYAQMPRIWNKAFKTVMS